MKPPLVCCAGILWMLIGPPPTWSQEAGPTAQVRAHRASNVLYVNPVHLVNGNITLSYERFISSRNSFTVTLSGGEKANYVAAAFDLNHYPAAPAALNYFIGGSLMAYESPILTGVPVSQPWNRFSESPDDRYYLAVQLKNGALFRLREFLYFGIDLAIGPAYNLSDGKWLSVWAISLKLGVPF